MLVRRGPTRMAERSCVTYRWLEPNPTRDTSSRRRMDHLQPTFRRALRYARAQSYSRTEPELVYDPTSLDDERFVHTVEPAGVLTAANTRSHRAKGSRKDGRQEALSHTRCSRLRETPELAFAPDFRVSEHDVRIQRSFYGSPDDSPRPRSTAQCTISVTIGGAMPCLRAARRRSGPDSAPVGVEIADGTE